MFSILIVDDERIVLNGVKMMIEESLCLPFATDIVTASNAPHALELLQHFTPDLILTDIRMPVMDGFVLIQQIREQLPDVDIAILTSHADFNYAIQGIRYQIKDFILKPIDETLLKETIIKSHTKKEQAELCMLNSTILDLRNMMLYDISPSELLCSEKQVQQLFPYAYFTVIVISFTMQATEDIRSCQPEIKHLLEQYYNVCHCFFLTEQMQLVVICNHQYFSAKPVGLIQKLTALIQHPDFHLGISISSNTYTTLHNLYVNALQRIFYEKNLGANPDLTAISFVTYDHCVQIFNEKNNRKAQELLTDYICNCRSISTEELSPEAIFQSFFQNLSLYLENEQISYENMEFPSFCHDISFEQLPSFLFQSLSSFKKELYQNLEPKFAENDALIKPLLEYIRHNYQKDISLDDLAECVKMHPNYVCTLFKKHIGQSYLYCLHKERLHAAKKLLKETNLTITEIAQQVGYNSVSQFARIFRKYEALSPSDFRSRQ